MDFELKLKLNPLEPISTKTIQFSKQNFGILHSWNSAQSNAASVFLEHKICPICQYCVFTCTFKWDGLLIFKEYQVLEVSLCCPSLSILQVAILFWHVDSMFSIMMPMCSLIWFTEQVARCCSFWYCHSLEA